MGVRAGSVLAAVAGLAIVAPAAANGRFPQAQQLVEDPNDPDRLVLRATFGVTMTTDRGKTWRIACESAVGYGGTEDPAMGIMSDGRLIAGVFNGLSSTTDFGCDWSFAGGGLTELYVVDLTVEQSDPSIAVAMVSMGMGGGMFLNQNHESRDAGKTWTKLGPDIDPTFLGLTIDPAPSDPMRLYMTGLRNVQDGLLLRSMDRGTTFESILIDGTDHRHSPFIGAVHPTNPDMLFVRTNGFEDVDGGPSTGNDALLVSTDAGMTFTEVIRRPAKLLGFALSPDGSEVLAGYGDARDSAVQNDATTFGIYKSKTDSFSFEKIYPGNINCLSWTKTGLYACTAQFTHGFEVGFANDTSFTLADTDFEPDPDSDGSAKYFKIPPGGKSALTPVLALRDVVGIVECASGTATGDLCPRTWPATCELLGRCVPEGGVVGGAGGVAGSGSGGAAGGAASGGAKGNGDAGGGGCACTVGANESDASWAALGFGLLALGRRRHRRACARVAVNRS